MKSYVYKVFAALLIRTAAGFALPRQSEQREFTVEDSISMTTFSEPSGEKRNANADRSPDGRYLFIITSRGLLSSNEVESVLWLFETGAIRHFLHNPSLNTPLPRPLPIARIRSVPDILTYDAYSSVISDVRWSSDSTRLFFLGMDSHAEKRLYEVSLSERKMRALTPIGRGVREFTVRGERIAYTAITTNRSRSSVPWDHVNEINADAGAVTGMGLEDILLFPEEGHGMGSARVLPDLWVGSPDRFRKVPDPEHSELVPDAEHYENVLSLSPNGRRVVRLLPITKLNNSWSWYEPKPGFESWKIKPGDNSVLSPSYWYRLREYSLVDLTSGYTHPLIDGPYGLSLGEEDLATAVWSQDGSRLLLGNVGMPLKSADQAELNRRQHICAVASVDLASSESRCIVFTRDAAKVSPKNPRPLRLKEALWGVDKDDVYLRFAWHGEWGQTEHYRYDQGQWKLREMIPGDPLTGVPLRQGSNGTSATRDITISIKQDLNTPPTLWAYGFGKTKQLWNPNPHLHLVHLGQASLYQWSDSDSYRWTGVLVAPSIYIPGKRYPLVIQTHGYRDYAFITDGIYPTAMAARPLSSAGFFVLQTTSRPDHMLTSQEALDEVTGWKAAITQLDADGLIDPKRVGVIGFSRTCWYVEQALIDSPDLFAAATIADGIDNSYMTYRLFGEGRPSMAREYTRIIGTAPIGQGLSAWIQRSPGFKLDSVKTPLRIEAIGPSSVLMEWEIYSSLREQHKPVDLIYIPNGQHILQKPLDRLASQQGNVDWFRFWLQGYEKPALSKQTPYNRWEQLKGETRP